MFSYLIFRVTTPFLGNVGNVGKCFLLNMIEDFKKKITRKSVMKP